MNTDNGAVLMRAERIHLRYVYAVPNNNDDTAECTDFYRTEFEDAGIPYPTKVGTLFWARLNEDDGFTVVCKPPSQPGRVPDTTSIVYDRPGRVTIDWNNRSVTFKAE